MPALDRLQATLGGPRFEVLALSIDRDGVAENQGVLQGTRIAAIGHLRRYRRGHGNEARRGGRSADAARGPARERVLARAGPGRMGSAGDRG
ncbi:MAG TPA: hypothetical protein VFR86_31290 [Burkholderiaceae bacterium]|nr:hypothetical protein [Burkholderiaceae bacterium]